MAVEHNSQPRAVAPNWALATAQACALACALLTTGLASAQSTPQVVPETSTMIDALRPAANRGARNLVVRETAPEPAAPVAPDAAGAVMAPPALPPSTSAATTSATTLAATSPAASPTPSPTPNPAGPASAAPSLSLAIQFDLNSASVRPESGAVLGNLVAAMMSPDLKSSRFVIEGHTDARGVPAANLRLSLQRADEVRLYLVALGVHPARLKTVGKGSSEPANPLDPLAADNRRVRVVTLE